MTVALKFGGMILGFLFVYWTVLFLAQRRLMFPAPIAFGAGEPPIGGERIWLDTPDGATEAWWLPPLGAVEPPFAMLIFGHGNGELIDHWPSEFVEPRDWGMAVLLVEYPGYGRSAGRPSQETIGDSFRTAYDWAVASPVVDPERIVGYGRSLGAAAVVDLSRHRRLTALILESAFTSTRPFARRLGAPGFLVRDVFDNLTVVERFDGPLLVIHGAEDEIIPVEHGKALALAAGVPLHELRCGHNDCPRSWRLISQFLMHSGVLPAGASSQGDVDTLFTRGGK